MFNPSISDSVLTRSEYRQERNADAIHDMLEWSRPSRQPAKAGFLATRERLEPNALTRRIVFTGKFWMADELIAAWRPITSGDTAQRPFRPVSDLMRQAEAAGEPLRALGRPRGTLIEGGAAPAMTKKARTFDELALEPIDMGGSAEELASVGKLAELELRVEVVKFAKPAADASGVSSGRVLAVSENYAAQHVGNNQVVIHENKNLDRDLRAGEKVTMAYNGGRGVVYDGIAHDVNIVATWMPKDQQQYMRMVMLDALSQMRDPQPEDERLRDAMRYALESTAHFFGVSETKLRRADIKLVVNERVGLVKAEASADTALQRSPKP